MEPFGKYPKSIEREDGKEVSNPNNFLTYAAVTFQTARGYYVERIYEIKVSLDTKSPEKIVSVLTKSIVKVLREISVSQEIDTINWLWLWKIEGN
ncbi:CLUMA_CG015492, isoform A [Clunio marinus]|uniref:CLUMA_CG015492, isoform A n=1 Tax=Clunio marinus TaxID=568069 RepID=A0A1J1IRJ3_9DIPT|nr:CLUMA_CG015492, isoform A [Clunio marinus]